MFFDHPQNDHTASLKLQPTYDLKKLLPSNDLPPLLKRNVLKHEAWPIKTTVIANFTHLCLHSTYLIVLGNRALSPSPNFI